MKIGFVASECVPFVKTGGLADVAGALPIALAGLGAEVKVFLPMYAPIQVADHDLVFCSDLGGISVTVGGRQVVFTTWYGHLPGSDVEVYLVDCPFYYHRPWVYTSDWDEGERFVLLQHAVFNIMQRYAWSPDILHCNDWQTGLIPAFVKKTYGWDQLFGATATLYSIHNIGYQGRFDQSLIASTGLDSADFYPGGPLELFGAFCFMKTGLHSADVIATVSETYAREIQTHEAGVGLDGLLRSRSDDLVGILNGIDVQTWNPETDPLIPANYSESSLDVKEENKKRLAEAFALEYSPDTPIVGIVSRLVVQKGLELLQPILTPLVEEHGIQFVALGSGERGYEDFLRWASERYPGRVGSYIGYNDQLSHWIEAGCDMFLMPSRYEPCGLNQMYSLRYGTVPIVRKTGGLADTVHDYHEYHGLGNGFSFVDFTPFALFTTVIRASNVFRDRETWREIQKRGMRGDFSWETSAKRYLTAYDRAMRNRRLT